MIISPPQIWVHKAGVHFHARIIYYIIIIYYVIYSTHELYIFSPPQVWMHKTCLHFHARILLLLHPRNSEAELYTCGEPRQGGLPVLLPQKPPEAEDSGVCFDFEAGLYLCFFYYFKISS